MKYRKEIKYFLRYLVDTFSPSITEDLEAKKVIEEKSQKIKVYLDSKTHKRFMRKKSPSIDTVKKVLVDLDNMREALDTGIQVMNLFDNLALWTTDEVANFFEVWIALYIIQCDDNVSVDIGEYAQLLQASRGAEYSKTGVSF